jgi:hypothetical protein
MIFKIQHRLSPAWVATEPEILTKPFVHLPGSKTNGLDDGGQARIALDLILC